MREEEAWRQAEKGVRRAACGGVKGGREEGGVSVPCSLGVGWGRECFACAAERARERGRAGWGGGVGAWGCGGVGEGRARVGA